MEGRCVEAPEKGIGQKGSGWVKRLVSQMMGKERDFCFSVFFRVLHEVPSEGIELMYVRERGEGRRGRRRRGWGRDNELFTELNVCA